MSAPHTRERAFPALLTDWDRDRGAILEEGYEGYPPITYQEAADNEFIEAREEEEFEGLCSDVAREPAAREI